MFKINNFLHSEDIQYNKLENFFISIENTLQLLSRIVQRIRFKFYVNGI